MPVRPPRTPPPRRGSEPSDVGPTIGIVVVLSLIVLIVGGGWWVAGHQARIDPQTLCPESGPTAATVLLLDSTDELNAIQKAAIEVKLQRYLASLVLHEQISVFEISGSGDPLKPVISLCRPTTAAEQSSMTGSKKRAQYNFETLFKAKVSGVLRDMLAKQPSERSPIMEAIQGASIASLQPLASTTPKRMIIVSDMLQNGAGGSHYDGVPDLDAFLRSRAFAHTRSHLDSVEVYILYLVQDDGGAVQGDTHERFWTGWFAAQGASVENIIPIEG